MRCEVVCWLVGRFILRKCNGSPRYIFISASLATLLPLLGYLMRALLQVNRKKKKKEKKEDHPIIWGFFLCYESAACTHCCDFMNALPIHELVKATAVQGFLSLIFHSQADTEIRGTLHKANPSVTCRVPCKHPISLTTAGTNILQRKSERTTDEMKRLHTASALRMWWLRRKTWRKLQNSSTRWAGKLTQYHRIL